MSLGAVFSEEQIREEVKEMYNKLYMDHVKKNLCDMVPKAITLYIIKKLLSYVSHDVLFHSMALPTDDHVSIAGF